MSGLYFFIGVNLLLKRVIRGHPYHKPWIKSERQKDGKRTAKGRQMNGKSMRIARTKAEPIIRDTYFSQMPYL